MYSYEWDEETGGLLLNTSPLQFSKEPRPVYYRELDILGFDKYWNYEKDDTYPYMWAEANNYWYRGRKVAKTSGGALYTAPEIVLIEDPEPDGTPLRFVDIPKMVEKNREIMESLVQETIKKVFNTYNKYKKKVDVFYVAFSGGKDSVVTLDIVQRALPHNEFKVLFGDTGMEFPDTYDVIDKISKYCKDGGIEFIKSSSDFSPNYTWNQFGCPATVTRWCCSVHKSAPQILALREHLGKSNFTGMAFIGVRASESLSRSDYDYLSLGEKHKGQYSCNPILEWNSAEIFLYNYLNNLILNEAYKKGNKRAGCLVCPRASERNEYMSRVCYADEFNKYIDVIRNLYKSSFNDENKLEEFLANGGWKARKNGRDLSIPLNYLEHNDKLTFIIKVTDPKTDWKEWIKTIGILVNNTSPYIVIFKNQQFCFKLEEFTDKNGYEVKFDSSLLKTNPLFIKLLKNVFRKAACCIGCRECEADCHSGCIKISNGKVKISDSCVHCSQCHKVEKGCLVYKSLELPNGGFKMIANKSLNCYSHHAPKMEWFKQFFSYKNEFDEKNTLGSQMYAFFKRFLRDSKLLENNEFSNTAEIIDKIGLENESSWGVMLVNLSYSPLVNWYVRNIDMNETALRMYIVSKLMEKGLSDKAAGDVMSSLTRLSELPFGEVGIGKATKEKRSTVSITRTPWLNPDPNVILYSLYKFAEACGDYYSFTLSRLLDHEVDSDGVSPTQIFGLDKETMKQLLTALSVNHPEFISVSFTLGLDNITLKSDKTSNDVLALF